MQQSVYIVLFALIIIASSGIPALFFSKKSTRGQRITVTIFLIGSLVGIAGTILSWNAGNGSISSCSWSLPVGAFTIMIDRMSALFLMIIFVVPSLGALFGTGYWNQRTHEDNGQLLGVSFGLLTGAMALVVISRNAVLFLIAWEIMALSAYFASTAENGKPEVQKAGWIYLIATHAGTLILLIMFALLHWATGSFSLAAGGAIPPSIAGTIFVLAVVGFGFKAGIMPFHVWLPGAHANAPSHVSAVMSGVMLKMGIYGIVRIAGLFMMNEIWWGGLLIVLGVISGIAGIAYALGQQDIKRTLAYSSIENIGIICIGIGLALIGRATGRYEWVILGLAGALLHCINHSLFKSLLFLSTGSVLHATHTKDMEKLGGLMKSMPMTAFYFVIGAIAISALPPLNGFIGEWTIYRGLFDTLIAGGKEGVALVSIATVALAMVGALVVATMVKVFGTVFLGNARTLLPATPRDAPFSMQLPMIILVLACCVVGLVPMCIIGFVEQAATSWTAIPANTKSLTGLLSYSWISIMGASIIAGIIVVLSAVHLLKSTQKMIEGVTWDCGYGAGTSRIQYTGKSFTQRLVDLFAFIILPRTHRVTVHKYFPQKSQFSESIPDLLLDRIMVPCFHFFERHISRVRIFQQGQTQIYVLYVFIFVLILFAFFR